MRSLKTHIGHTESNLRQTERIKDELEHIPITKTVKHVLRCTLMFMRELFLSLFYCMKISDQNFKEIEKRLKNLEEERG